jgi:predicted RNA-binding Zn ribbon-like protein
MLDVSDLSLVGGDLALDFVNTVETRAGEPDDTLRGAADLRAWGVRVGVLDGGAGSGRELARAIALRESLYRLLAAWVDGDPLDPADLELLTRTVAEAHAAGALVRAGGRLAWTWDRSDLATVRFTAAVAAAELLAGPRARRIRRCPAADCGWLFLDATKNGSRRWCSMSDCGNREKARRRRARRT